MTKLTSVDLDGTRCLGGPVGLPSARQLLLGYGVPLAEQLLFAGSSSPLSYV